MIFILSFDPHNTRDRRTVRELGAEGAKGDGGRITAALVGILIPLLTFPGRNPGMCWRGGEQMANYYRDSNCPISFQAKIL